MEIEKMNDRNGVKRELWRKLESDVIYPKEDKKCKKEIVC